MLLYFREDIMHEIPILTKHFESWQALNKIVVETEDYLKDLHQQMALVKEAEAHGLNNHPLYTLPSRYESYRKTKEAMNTAMRDLDSLINDCELHLQTYSTAVNAIGGNQFSQWVRELNANVDHESFKVFDLVKEFLQNAGQTSMIEQCEQSENEVLKVVQQQNIVAKKCLQLLQDYNSVLSQCPVSLMEQHRMCLILKWSKYLRESKNLITCDAVYKQFCAFLDMKSSPLVKPIVEFSYGLNVLYNEAATQATKLYEDLSKMRSQETITSLEKLYSNARIGITSFLTREKGAANALEFVIVSELLLLNQNFLTLETAAHRSGDWLIKLTSRDGDWFLDELVLNSNRAVEMINNLPLQQNPKEDAMFMQALNGVRIANNLYRGLQELNFNFHTIILPESMKKIQNEEPSVIQMIADLNVLIMNLGMSIPDLILQLEKILPCILMQMDVSVSVFFIYINTIFVKCLFKVINISIYD